MESGSQAAATAALAWEAADLLAFHHFAAFPAGIETGVSKSGRDIAEKALRSHREQSGRNKLVQVSHSHKTWCRGREQRE